MNVLYVRYYVDRNVKFNQFYIYDVRTCCAQLSKEIICSETARYAQQEPKLFQPLLKYRYPGIV